MKILKTLNFVVVLMLVLQGSAQIPKNISLSIQQGHTQNISELCMLEGRNWLISVSHDKSVLIWDLSTGRQIKRLNISSNPIKSMAVCPDETMIALGTVTNFTDEAKIILVSLHDFSVKWIIPAHRFNVTTLAFSPVY